MSNNKYNVTISNKHGESIVVDVYDIIYGCGVTCPALQHATKKLLNAGKRGHKDTMEDLVDIRDSAERAIELERVRSGIVKTTCLGL